MTTTLEIGGAEDDAIKLAVGFFLEKRGGRLGEDESDEDEDGGGVGVFGLCNVWNRDYSGS